MARWQPPHHKPLVCVHWLDSDASAPTTAFYEDEIASVHKTTPMESYGLLLQEDSEGVTLMTEYYDDGKPTFRGRSFIMARLILRVERLLEPSVSRPHRKSRPHPEAVSASASSFPTAASADTPEH